MTLRFLHIHFLLPLPTRYGAPPPFPQYLTLRTLSLLFLHTSYHTPILDSRRPAPWECNYIASSLDDPPAPHCDWLHAGLLTSFAKDYHSKPRHRPGRYASRRKFRCLIVSSDWCPALRCGFHVNSIAKTP
ncbi:hypothetical protein CONLIGDRAFT_68655 [Coniochaeta ligniaria NRRL 30616]|uniref:Uncharacterized protein n=1 Tax=Coniochaeta ligniaria NRRL 30616 TaxID=1408157 RepID=A0A1J7JQM2_9PEZI|nr:hypothetical protein CONLIGDRAFT_68655 [Coniochaeta ligniaria NRRL 30616]